MREPGRVVRVTKDNVVVEMQPLGGCHGCPLNRLCAAKERQLTVRGFEGIHVGDVVEVEIPARGVTSAALLVFLIPVMASLAASVGAYSLTGSRSLEIVSFFGSLVLFEGTACLIDRRCRAKDAFQPAIRRKISGSGEQTPLLNKAED